MKTIQINSSRGSFTIDAATGDVIDRKLDIDASIEYRRMFRFDVKEWWEQWGIGLPDEIDILDIGAWYIFNDKVEYDAPSSEFRADLIEGDPVVALQRARRLMWNASTALCNSRIQLEPHDKLAGETGQIQHVKSLVDEHANRLTVRMAALMADAVRTAALEADDEDPPLPDGYDPGNDLGDVMDDSGPCIRIQQHIVNLQHQLVERRQERAADARDLNAVAAKLWPIDSAGPEHQAIQRLGERLCGSSLADGSDIEPPVWE